MSTKDNKAGASPEAENPVGKPAEPVKELDSPEARQKKKKEEKEKKLKNIKQRLERSNLSDDTKKLATTAIDSDDDDELNLVEQLLSRTIVMTQDEFAKKLAEIREKKAKIKKGEVLPSLETNLKVKNTVFNKLKASEVPGNKKRVNEKINAKGKEIEKLNIQHQSTVKEILDLLQPFIKDKKITEEDAQKIAQLDPCNPAKFETYFYKLLGDLAKNKMLVQGILGIKNTQKELNEKFEDALADVKEMLEQETKDYFYEKERFEKIRALSRTTGIQIFEGQEIEYMGVSKTLQRTRQTLRINTIKYERQNSLADNPPSDLSAEEILELEQETANLPKVLKLSVTIDREDGTSETIQMSQTDFAKFIDANEATEVINSQEELEQKIGFAEFEQSLKVGMELEYVKGLQPSGFPLYDKVKIENIDRANGKIRLSSPVIAMTNVHQDQYGKIQNRFKTELTFGEFAKWTHRYRAEEKMSLEKARKTVKQMPHILKLRYPQADPHVVVFNDLPIEIKKGEKLKFGDKKEAKIKDVSDNEITLSTGEKFTPGQFLRFVKEHEVEKAEKLQIPDDIAQKIEETVAEEKKASPKKSESVDESPQSDESIGPLAEIWSGLTFLSARDIMKIIDTSKEYFKRRYERNSKRRAAIAGSNFPGRWGTEFKNLTQTAENEEVSKYEGDMEQNGVWYIQDRLHSTNSPDEFKACINLLTKKASFNFSDGKVWESMNRILSQMKSPSDAKEWKINFKKDRTAWGFKYIPLKNEKGRLPVDAVKDMMSELWGQPGGTDWYAANESAYDGNVGKFTTEAATLESDPQNNGGPAGALHQMLIAHRKGEYVEPYRYEAFIKQILSAGKAEFEDKFFYMFAGLAVRNKRGDTLLNMQRISSINGLMNQVPHLDFMVRYTRDGDGERMSEDYVQSMWQRFSTGPGVDVDTPPTAESGNKEKRYNYHEVRKFVWEDAMTYKAVLSRTKKAMRAANIDHDDAHAAIPMVDEAQILADVLSNRQTGSAFTAEGQANGVAGYTHYMRSLGKISMRPQSELEKRAKEKFEDPKKLIRQTFKSWLFYEGQVTGRVSFNPSFRHLSGEALNSNPLVDGDKTVIQHANEMREVLRKVLTAYGMKPNDIHDYLDFKSTNLQEEDIKKAHLAKVKNFPNVFDKLVSSDNGAKMTAIVQECVKDGSLEGFRGKDMTQSKEAKEKKEAAAEARSKEADELIENTQEIDLVRMLREKKNQANNAVNSSSDTPEES